MFLAGSCLSRCLAKENSDWVVRINSIPARQRRALEVCAGPNRQPERARKQRVMRSESGCAECGPSSGAPPRVRKNRSIIRKACLAPLVRRG